MEKGRYIKNDYADYVDGQATYNEIELLKKTETALDKRYTELIKVNPHTSTVCIESDGNKSEELNVYVGTYGNVYIQWRLYELFKSRKDAAKMKLHLEAALEAFAISQTLLKKSQADAKKKKRNTSPSFFMGSPGLHTLGAILFKEAGKPAEMMENYKQVISYLPLCKEAGAEDEILYGNAGYLYCLLFLYTKDPVTFACKEEIVTVVNLLFESGKLLGGGAKLQYQFPKKKGRLYLGAAHGTFGILYLIMKAVQIVSDLAKDSTLLLLLRNSCQEVLTMQFPSGNFPTAIGGTKDELIHFCHGAPGAIPMLLEAYNLYKEESFLKAAFMAGEALWERGILLKGNGLCHGISGNAYFLHYLYRATGDEKWKYRFYIFADATWNAEIQAATKGYTDPSRITSGSPDTPYSLMEGMGGDVVFYADLLHESDGMPFPGYTL